MASVEERLLKLREERIAREKARIDKLREMNLKKYGKTDTPKPSVSNMSLISKSSSKPNPIANKNGNVSTKTVTNPIKNYPPVNSSKILTKKPNLIPKVEPKKVTATKQIIKMEIPKLNTVKHVTQARKSIAPNIKTVQNTKMPSNTVRKSIAPPKQHPVPNNRESVFDRLYKPKPVSKAHVDDATRLKTDPNFLKKVIKDSCLILNKRHTTFEVKPKVVVPVRRSISAVHLKKIGKHEINNCIHKWSSVGEKLDKVHLAEINEDEALKQDKIVSAVKSERKRVKFQTPVPMNFNTPRPEELQERLKSWLQKRGKSLDSFHHLQCFGIHHMPLREIKPISVPQLDLYDDEDKENIALEHDSDNDSYSENMNGGDKLDVCKESWRRASYVSDADFNDTQNSTLTTSDNLQVDEVLLGALNDLTELLREGFDWEQCARWLRAIRDRFPFAPDSAAYWECRAALEERRGDLPASVQCWEEAIAKGTERSVVESNLDQLLDKFMQLKISPNSGKSKPESSKMVDVKNVFKSTIIRFAVQQAKLRRSAQLEAPKYTVTPVRRSSRLSCQWSAKRPLQECMSVRQAKELAPVHFVPNPSLCRTP